MMRIRQTTVVGLVVVIFASGVLTWALWPQGGAESQEAFDPADAWPVVEELLPGTTLHIVQTSYRRYGAEATDVPQTEGPETQRGEVWITFDSGGALAMVEGEVRTSDSTLVSTTALEGDDLVYRNADGTERLREGAQGTTVDGLRANFVQAASETYDAVSGQPDARLEELDGTPVLVLEDRQPSSDSAPPAESPGFQLPYVGDLNPVEKVRRSYVLPDEFRTVRSEVVIVGEDGTETVVEYREYLVFEVLPADAGA